MRPARESTHGSGVRKGYQGRQKAVALQIPPASRWRSARMACAIESDDLLLDPPPLTEDWIRIPQNRPGALPRQPSHVSFHAKDETPRPHPAARQARPRRREATSQRRGAVLSA